MSPKTALVISAASFAILCAATLAYYLPRLNPQTGPATPVPPASSSQSVAADSSNDSVLPQSDATHGSGATGSDVDQMLAQSLPVRPNDIEHLGAAMPDSPRTDVPAPKMIPDPALVQLLDHPSIQFEISSSTLTPTSRVYLDKLARLLQSQPAVHLSIEGHTDSQDRLGKNQTLSETRAKAVMDYLVSKGVSADRMSSAGYGGSMPIADNATAEGRAKNRRIEFKLSS